VKFEGVGFCLSISRPMSARCCAHCGKQGVGFPRCLVCKQAYYCGAGCQKADWKRHKNTCAPPLPVHAVMEVLAAQGADALHAVMEKVLAADGADDWRGMLKWEGRVEELMEGIQGEQLPPAMRDFILSTLVVAHSQGLASTGSRDHAISIIGLQQRRVELLGTMQRFRDQGGEMCVIGDQLSFLDKNEESAAIFQRARELGAAHGFFSVECRACLGLGMLATSEGRDEEALELLRNSLAAARLSENEGSSSEEMIVLHSLIDALFQADELDELEPLVPRYREVAKTESRAARQLSFQEVWS